MPLVLGGCQTRKGKELHGIFKQLNSWSQIDLSMESPVNMDYIILEHKDGKVLLKS